MDIEIVSSDGMAAELDRALSAVITTPTIADQADGTLWYVVVPDGMAAIQHRACYAGPDRAQALDRLVALLAQGVDVNAGERFRRSPSDAYVSVSRIERAGDRILPVLPLVEKEGALLDEARAAFAADAAERGHECDRCFVQPDGTHDDGTTCPCSLREPRGGCRCQASQAEWYGPAYIRAEIAADEV